MSDHSPVVLGQGPGGVGTYHSAAIDLARSADLLIHDGQLTKGEFAEWASFGHSAVEYAIGLAEVAGAKKLLLFHHDPARTDDQIDAIVAAHRNGPVPTEAAREGETIDLG
jgi:ribonuclease BN (tRNA processing enzyme)